MQKDSFKVVTANITQLFKFNGRDIFDQSFSSFSPKSYIDFLTNLSPDIMCLQEMQFDNRNGGGVYVDQLAKALGAEYYKTQVLEESWIYEGKFFGLAIFSKYPIIDYEYKILPNPGLSVIRPNGDKWKIHDKGFQTMTVDINGKKARVLNLHYFPIFLFYKKFRDAECLPSLEAFSKMLNLENDNRIVAAGDFNNYGEKIQEFLPELFSKKNIGDAVSEGKTTIIGSDHDTLDHILYSPNTLKPTKVEVIKYFSDHFCVSADFEFIDNNTKI